MFDLAGLIFNCRQLVRDTFDISGHRGQLASQLRIALREFANGGVFVRRREFRECRFLQHLRGTSLPFRVHGVLHNLDFAAQASERAGSHVELRFRELQPYVITDNLLVETIEFRSSRIKLEFRRKLARIGDYCQLSWRWGRVDDGGKRIHTAAQLVDALARLGGAFGLR